MIEKKHKPGGQISFNKFYKWPHRCKPPPDVLMGCDT